MTTTRRRFLKTVAATAAAAAVAPAGALAETTAPAAHKPAAHKASAAPADPVQAEIARQKKGVEELVMRLHEEKLVNAVEPAFVFRPMRARRKELGHDR
jgi:hypothetical protein